VSIPAEIEPRTPAVRTLLVRTVAIDPVQIDTRRRKAAMYQFQCAHQECFSQYTASSKDALMQQVADHLKEAHNVDKATETLMSYLEATCVTTR
jgi:predicted small metal-binding protein